MSNSKSPSGAELPSSELWFIRACLVAAFGISAFLAWNSLQGGGVPGCGPDSACDKVLSSRWAYVFGLPISIFALPVYLALLGLTWMRRISWKYVTPLALLVLAAALWFVGVQAFALRAFCKFCMTAHTAGVLAALMLLRRTPLSAVRISMAAALATLGIAALALAQVGGTAPGPKRLVSQSPLRPVALSSPAVSNVPAALPPEVSASGRAQTFSIIDGLFTLDLGKVPVTGPANAPKKVAKLFDYTCHHCRTLHLLLKEFREAHSNELAVVSLPLPLDSSCNPVVKRTPPAHTNACQYAALGLAVFQADASKFERFTDWIFAPPRPPELSMARAYAAKLVGTNSLAQAMQNPAVGAQIKMDVDIYLAAYRRARSGQLPQMYFEQGASIGAVETREQLQKIMAENLGFPPEAPSPASHP